jgi:hypothetical protein
MNHKKKTLIDRMRFHGFVFQDEHFWRCSYIGGKGYSDVIKFEEDIIKSEDAPKWIASLYSDEDK